MARILKISIDDELTLKTIVPERAMELYRLVETNRNHLREWLPWLDGVVSAGAIRDFLEDSEVGLRRGSGFQLGIHSAGQLAGVIGFHAFDRTNRITSMGYWLAANYMGRGLMTRSVKGLVSWAFREQDMNRIVIRCATGNSASRKIPERLGFRHEGRQRQAEWLYDHFVDLEMYALLREEWARSKIFRTSSVDP